MDLNNIVLLVLLIFCIIVVIQYFVPPIDGDNFENTKTPEDIKNTKTPEDIKYNLINKNFINKYEKILKKHKLISINKKFDLNTIKDCVWINDSKSLKPKYIDTLEDNKQKIKHKDDLHKLYMSLGFPYFIKSGSLLSAVRGYGYLKNDDIDLIMYVKIPDNISHIHKELPDMVNENNVSDPSMGKILTTIVIYSLIKNGAHWLGDFTSKDICEKGVCFDISLDFYPKKVKDGFYFLVRRIGYIQVFYYLNNVRVLRSDLEIENIKDFPTSFGKNCKINIENQDILSLEGAHKRTQFEYGPTYMTPQKCYEYPWNGFPECPYMKEFTKKWEKTEFKEEQAHRQFWEKENKIYKKK